MFIDDLNTVLHNLKTTKCESIITGDFNIDLLKVHEKPIIQEYIDMILANSYIPKITFPTRITNHSATLIDNIFVKLSTNYSQSLAGILTHQISDHQSYFITLDYIKNINKTTKYVKLYNNSDQSIQNFKTEIENVNLMSLLKNDIKVNPNVNYNILQENILLALDKHLPVKFVKYNKYKHKRTKWITHGIIKSIKYRDKLYKKLHNTPLYSTEYNNININLKTYNRILKQSIRLSKNLYYQSCFNNYKNDIKKTWCTIKEILNNKKFLDLPSHFMINGVLESKLENITNAFNKYFIEIGPNLASKITQPPEQSFKDYLTDPVTNEFNFELVDTDEVLKTINTLKIKSSSGIDKLSNKLLKLIANQIAGPLTLIINQSFYNGNFPDMLKIAKVTPIYKKGDSNIFDNYRPISVLPSVSKVIERIMHNQIHKYFTNLELYYKSQYGFRSQHSTELAALDLIDRVISMLDQNEIPLNIYLDLSKAFDTLDHGILLHKLYYYGIRNKALKLIESYLLHRKQYVEINDIKSDLLSIKTGVPQGSILGPLFFLIYINDIAQASNKFYPIIYADDTTLSATLSTFGDNSSKTDGINSELSKIMTWLKLNRLSLNISKTKAMMFHMPQKVVEAPELKLDGTIIEYVNEFNFLGICIDKHLTWKSHINYITNKLNKTNAILCKLKNILPQNILITIYNTLFLPYLNYGNILWNANFEKLYKLQKKSN